MNDTEFLATLASLENPYKAKKTTSIGASALIDLCQQSVIAVAHNLMLDGWKLTITTQTRGWCNASKKLITYPSWLLTRNHDFRVWYVCHELAHALDKCKHGHGPEFMQYLIQLCPPEYVHHELSYKPRNAKQAGIREQSSDIATQLGF